MSIFADKKTRQLGYGAMGITAFYGAAMEDDAALELLTGVFNSGCHFIDTAEIYRSDFPQPASETSKWNEEAVGLFLATVDRSAVTVGTKYYPRPTQDLKTVTAALDASLTRLGTDYVDIYYLHRCPDSGLRGLLEWMESVKVLVGEGKIRNVGVSEVCAEWLRQAHAVHPLACIQQEWSLLTRNLESSLVPVCAELDIAIVAYSPLARNLLAGVTEKPSDWRATLPRYSDENFARNLELGAQIATLGQTKSASAAQLSLAWLYHQAERLGVKVVAIPGTTKIANHISNMGSLQLNLSDDDMDALTALGESVAGARAYQGYMDSAIEGQEAKLEN